MTTGARALRWSLQTTLLVGMVAVTLLASGFAVWLTVSAAEFEAGKLHDRTLAQVAALLLGMADHEIEELGDLATVEARIQNARSDNDAILQGDYRYQLWTRDGQHLLSNFGGRATVAPIARFGASGYSWLMMDGELWRIFSLQSTERPYEIHVAERAALRGWAPSLVGNPFVKLFAPVLMLVMLPALWLFRRLLRPLRDLAADLEARQASNLSPVVIERAPNELTPLVSALNRLLNRVAVALQRETEFTATAAHELRTPLANLRMLAEAAGHAATEDERADTLRQLVSCVDRCAHLQEQLLTLSRLDAMTPRDDARPVELIDVVTEALSDLRYEAKQAGVTMATRLDDSAIHGHRFGVLTLLRNLVANAVRHTPRGGRVEVSMQSQGDSVRLHVDDSGPGIPAEERERVFERFERLRSTVHAGTGLGLSIVRRVAVLHGAVVTLEDSPLGGLRVVVDFRGRAAQSAGNPAQASAIGDC